MDETTGCVSPQASAWDENRGAGDTPGLALASPVSTPEHIRARLGGAYHQEASLASDGEGLLLRALGASWAGAGIGVAFGVPTGFAFGSLLCIDAEPITCLSGILAGLMVGASVGLLSGAVAGVVRSVGRSAEEGLALFGVTLAAAAVLAAPLIGIHFATGNGGSLASAIAVPLAAIPFMAPLLGAALFGDAFGGVAPTVTPVAGGVSLGAVGSF